MQRYLEAFFRHLWVVVTPILLCVLVSGTIVTVQPRSYQATSHLWFEDTALAQAGQSNRPNGASLDQTPAEVAVDTFQELLGTRTFSVNVGRRGPLADYLAQPGHMSGGLSAKLGVLENWGQPKRPIDQVQAIDDALLTILQKHVKVGATGPQVVAVSFTFNDPQLATSTLQALLEEFAKQVGNVRQAQNQEQQDVLSLQVSDELKRMQQADAQAQQYLTQHKELQVSNPPPDSTFAGLQQDATLAHQRYASLLQDLEKVKLDEANLLRPAGAGYRIIDPPHLPDRPAGFLKSLVLGVLGGFAAGLLIALLALTALVRADDSVNEAGLDSLGLRLAGTVPFARTEQRRHGDQPSGSTASSGRAV